MLGEEDAMLLPEMLYETDQTASERANGADGGHSSFMSHQSTSMPM